MTELRDSRPLESPAAGEVIVAVDVIRATTTAVTAAAMGKPLYPAGSIEAAVRPAADLDRPILAGELGEVQPYGFDLQNSPTQIEALDESTRPIILKVDQRAVRALLALANDQPLARDRTPALERKPDAAPINSGGYFLPLACRKALLSRGRNHGIGPPSKRGPAQIVCGPLARSATIHAKVLHHEYMCDG